jgi:molybdopterin synthase catalytic subunit
MAEQELSRLAERLLREQDLIAINVQHSEGSVAAGEISFRLRIASRHRKEGLRAMDEFIDCMKRDVPIWKRPLFAQEVV